jgi:hypothetical protein
LSPTAMTAKLGGAMALWHGAQGKACSLTQWGRTQQQLHGRCSPAADDAEVVWRGYNGSGDGDGSGMSSRWSWCTVAASLEGVEEGSGRPGRHQVMKRDKRDGPFTGEKDVARAGND